MTLDYKIVKRLGVPHEFVSEILTELVREISTLPKTEGVILIAHGPYGDLCEPRWIDLLKTHGTRIQELLFKLSGSSFNDFSYFTLRDDSPALIRDERTRLLRLKVKLVVFHLNNRRVY